MIAAARAAPEHGDQPVEAMTERIGAAAEKIRIAVRFYAEYPDDIDRWMERVEVEAERHQLTLERERRILG